MKRHLIVLIITFAMAIIGCSKSNTDINDYLNSGNSIDEYAKNFMPSIDELPKFKDIHYQHNNINMILFESNSITLVVEYDEDTYKKEKENLEDKYTFLKDKAPFDDIEYAIPKYVFSINSYDFKVEEDKYENSQGYPKTFGMVGTSDEKNSIAYLYFQDLDLDYIGSKDQDDPMADFVKQHFKHNF